MPKKNLEQDLEKGIRIAGLLFTLAEIGKKIWNLFKKKKK